MFLGISQLGHCGHLTWNIQNVLSISCTGKIVNKLAWKIQNVPAVYQMGTLWVLCPFPYNVLTVFQLGTPGSAPSDSIQLSITL